MTATSLTAFNAADWTMDFSLMVQARNVGEAYDAPCPFYLIEHPEGTVLFDTGVSHEMTTDPGSYGPSGAPHMADFVPGIDMTEADTPRNQLADAGYDPGAVDYVVLSHLHCDHAGNVTAFPDAEVVVQQEELRYAFWPEPAQRLFYLAGDFVSLRSHEYSVTPVAGSYDVFGDGIVTTLPTPGHSPGHQSLRVELPDEGTVVLGADVANHRVGYDNELAPSFAWSLPEAVESMRSVQQAAKSEDARVVLAHDRDDLDTLPDPPESLA